jgi:hypothetical protein
MCSSPEAIHLWSRRRWMAFAAAIATQAVEGEELRRISRPNEQLLDPSLLRLIEQLRKIVWAREHLPLEALMGPTFRVEFDAGKGPAAFRRRWAPEKAESAVWTVLRRLLVLPGHQYSGSLVALPYVFARFPFDLDPLQYVVAVKEGVTLLAEPRPDAKRVGSLDYSIIPLAQPLPPPVLFQADGFLEVVHPTAGHCFAASGDLYHPLAHRSFFEKRGGRWRWISLAAATSEDPPELRRHRPANG